MIWDRQRPVVRSKAQAFLKTIQIKFLTNNKARNVSINATNTSTTRINSTGNHTLPDAYQMIEIGTVNESYK